MFALRDPKDKRELAHKAGSVSQVFTQRKLAGMFTGQVQFLQHRVALAHTIPLPFPSKEVCRTGQASFSCSPLKFANRSLRPYRARYRFGRPEDMFAAC